ncbi:MAG: acetyl-CoA carboxylase biotin carboxyl carrier protein [Bacteroidetes bacterium]|nr:MAG: acetyl-CoA carboxylase biotin carboxyl carrier protein [Bacteroidota bacterium]
MEFKEIQDILKLINKTNLTEVEIEKKDFKIRIRKKLPESSVIYTAPQAQALPQVQAVPPSPVSAPPPAQPQAEAPEAEKPAEKPSSAEENLYVFKSPMIGTFYRAGSPESEPYVKVGDHIQKGQVVCIIEAMKLFNEIESEVEGKVVKILVENAQPVEYDQPLFLIDTNG